MENPYRKTDTNNKSEHQPACTILACAYVASEDTGILNDIIRIENKLGLSEDTELPPDCPIFELVSNSEHIRNKMSEKGRAKIFKHKPPFSDDEIIKLAERWTSQTGMGDRLFFKGTHRQLVAVAAVKLILKAGIPISRIDMIKIARNNLSEAYPSLSDYVLLILMEYFHDHTKCHVSCLDYQEACSAGLEAVRSGWQAIRADDADCVLVISAEMATNLLSRDKQDSNLFSDGAAGVILIRSDEEIFVHRDGKCSPQHGNLEKIKQTPDGFEQEGGHVLKFVSRNVVPRTKEVIQKLLSEDPHIRKVHVISHQPSIRLLEPFSKEIAELKKKYNENISENEKIDIVFHMDKTKTREDGVERLTGNTSSASTLILFAKLVLRGEIEAGSLVYFVAFGSGYSYISLTIKMPEFIRH